MRLLFVGDVFGDPGRRAVQKIVPELKRERSIDIVVINGENAARGLGITPRLARDLFDAGADGITLGNHAFRQRDILPMLNTDDRIIRPANFAAAAPGKGLMVLEVEAGSLAVINLMGSLFLPATARGAFDMVDELVEQASEQTNCILVDMHAEATSEKVAIAHHLDGRVTAVVGTHTHVQTSDARILSNGTGYITDVGMTGPHDSVIGVRAEIIVKKFLTDLTQRFEPADSGIQLEAVQIDIDTETGKTTAIEAVRVPLES